ncbi:MAG: hypothetical protein GX854_10260, partial [Clostridiales bacterium]|nr:hypothetical protein [Clostridiales bacterium]
KKLNDQFSDIKTETSGLKPSSNKMQEAVSALIMLGYSSQEANAAVLAVYAEEKSIEQIIKDALKNSI